MEELRAKVTADLEQTSRAEPATDHVPKWRDFLDGYCEALTWVLTWMGPPAAARPAQEERPPAVLADAAMLLRKGDPGIAEKLDALIRAWPSGTTETGARAASAPHFDAHGAIKHYCTRDYCPDLNENSMVAGAPPPPSQLGERGDATREERHG